MNWLVEVLVPDHGNWKALDLDEDLELDSAGVEAEVCSHSVEQAYEA